MIKKGGHERGSMNETLKYLEFLRMVKAEKEGELKAIKKRINLTRESIKGVLYRDEY